MVRIVFLAILLLSGCASQHEREAEKLYMDAISLEARGTEEAIVEAYDMYLLVFDKYRDTKYGELANLRCYNLWPNIGTLRSNVQFRKMLTDITAGR